MPQELPHLLFRMTVSESAVRHVALTKVFNWAELCATVMATACDSHHFILIKPLTDPLCPCVEASAFIKHSQWRDISHLAETVIKRLSAHLRQTHWISVREASRQRCRSLRLPGIFVVQDTGPGPHIVLLLKVHFLPDVQAAKSTVTIQFSTFFDCSATPEPKPHTSADKRLHTPSKVGAKSSLHSISLTLAWLPVRHFNLISFPKLEAVLIVKESRTSECYPHMYTHTCTRVHTHTQAHEGILLLVPRQG